MATASVTGRNAAFQSALLSRCSDSKLYTSYNIPITPTNQGWITRNKAFGGCCCRTKRELWLASAKSARVLDVGANSSTDDIESMRYGIASSQGPRETMEDVAYVVEKGPCGLLFATVLDGHAGIASAEYLREHLFDSIKSVLTEYSFGESCSAEELDEGLCCPLELTSVLTSSYQKADEKLLAWLKKQPAPESGSGCTATTVLVDTERIIVANVGDSRAVMSRTSGPIDLSVEHRVYGSGETVATESKRVEESGGWVEDGRVCGILAVSRAFGDSSFKGAGLKSLLEDGVKDGFWTRDFARSVNFVRDPVISVPDVLEMSVSFDTDEFVIVASDGLWDVVSSKEGCEFVKRELKKGHSPDEAATRLVDIATRRRTSDNVAVVVIDLKGKRYWKDDTKKTKIFGLF